MARARAEAVEMIAERYRFLPHLFRWRGWCYEVEEVERCWTMVRRRGAERRFQVRCPDGSFELRQDLSTGAWSLGPGTVQPVPTHIRRQSFCRRTAQALGANLGQSPRRRPLSSLGQALSAAVLVCRPPRARSVEGG
jgi:hypothetical protein